MYQKVLSHSYTTYYYRDKCKCRETIANERAKTSEQCVQCCIHENSFASESSKY